MLPLVEQDFGQGLNPMVLFQETIAETGQVIIVMIMEHGDHCCLKIIQLGQITALLHVISKNIFCVSCITEVHTNY